VALAGQEHRSRGPGAAGADHDRVVLVLGHVTLLLVGMRTG
jgi:hypothetical protein